MTIIQTDQLEVLLSEYPPSEQGEIDAKTCAMVCFP